MPRDTRSQSMPDENKSLFTPDAASGDAPGEHGGQAATPPKPAVLRAIALTFTALADARERCRLSLAESASGLELAFDPGWFEQGEPVLATAGPEFFLDDFQRAAACLLPEMLTLFPAVSGELDRLDRAMRRDRETALACLTALQTPDDQARPLWDVLAERLGLPAEVAAFGTREVLKVCLSRLEPLLAAQLPEASWFRGYCPICGSCPDLGYLAPKAPEPNDFLISKSGEMHLHCAACGHAWRNERIKCPVCETSDHEKFFSLREGDKDEERVYICLECGSYFPCIDLTEGRGDVRFDTAVLDLLHLEYVARSRGFTPAASQPWNVFA
jgi:FdhE protein